MGLLFISHDLSLVAQIADSIGVMLKGELVEYGKAADILQFPKHAYTQSLLGCRPVAYSNEPFHRVAEPLVTVRDLTVSFGRFTAVDQLNFDILRGETLGLVGESGCGKTTLGRTLLGLISPSAGEIRFNGEPIRNIKNRSTQMQLIFQDPYSSLNPSIRVGNALDEVLRYHTAFNKQQRRERIVDLFEKVGLTEAQLHRYPHEFSGGQRQRIVIARALILQPAFVVCDESVSALDVRVQAQVLKLLNDLKRELGFTALFISHDLSVVRSVSDRILVMQQGRIVESGDKEQIYLHPKHPYTQQLIEAIPIAIN
jgi:peptide/nickel transport system ATP-binding protein